MKETIEAKEKEIVEFNNTINNVRVNKVPAISFNDKTKTTFDKNYIENGTFIDKMISQITTNQEVIVQFKKAKENFVF
ncbi:MAG: hypothetical protein ACM3VV_01780 [Deltaproteobacteria bacterium]|jgi:hypothetical protein